MVWTAFSNSEQTDCILWFAQNHQKTEKVDVCVSKLKY